MPSNNPPTTLAAMMEVEQQHAPGDRPLAERLANIADELATLAKPGGREMTDNDADAMWGHGTNPTPPLGEIEIRRYETADFDGLKALWEEAFPNDPPWNRAEVSVPAKVTVQPELLLVAVRNAELIGSVMAGYDGHRGWLYAVAVRHKARRSKVGTVLVHHAEQALQALGCSKINLQVRASEKPVVAFYEGLGYMVEDRISLGKHL